MFTHQLVGLAGNLGLSLPVLGVDGLDEFVKGWQAGRFLMVHHLILNVTGEAFVCLSKKGRIAPLETCCEVVKLNKVKGHLGTLRHTQPLNLSLGLSYWVEGPEVGSQLVPEKGPTEKPRWVFVLVK